MTEDTKPLVPYKLEPAACSSGGCCSSLDMEVEAARALAEAGAREETKSILAHIEYTRAGQRYMLGHAYDLPDLDPMLARRPGGATPEQYAEQLEIPSEARAFILKRSADSTGHNNWSVVLTYYLSETIGFASENNPHQLRFALIRLAAYAVAWAEALDRRK